MLVVLAASASCRTHKPIVPAPVFPLTTTWSVADEASWDQGDSYVSLVGGSDGVALLSLQSGALRVLDCSNGALLWTRNDLPGAIAVGDGFLLIARRNGALRALNLLTGEEAWKTQTVVSDPAPPVITGGLILVAGHGLSSLDAKTGALRWSMSEGRYASSPRLIGKVIVTSDVDGVLRGFDAATGKLLWTRRTYGTLFSPATGESGRLYLGTTEGWFLALRASNGKLVWRWRVGAGALFEAVLYKNQVCFVGYDAVLYALNRRNGHMLWRAPLPSRPLGPPLLVHQTLLVPCYSDPGQSRLVGIDVTNGRRVGSFDTPAELAAMPLPCGARFILGMRDRSVVSVVSPSPTPTPTPRSSPDSTAYGPTAFATPSPAPSPSVAP